MPKPRIRSSPSIAISIPGARRRPGNARTIGCHLHFEIRSRGRPVDPEPELHA